MISTDAIFQKPQYHSLGTVLEKLAEDGPERQGHTAMFR